MRHLRSLRVKALKLRVPRINADFNKANIKIMNSTSVVVISNVKAGFLKYLPTWRYGRQWNIPTLQKVWIKRGQEA